MHCFLCVYVKDSLVVFFLKNFLLHLSLIYCCCCCSKSISFAVKDKRVGHFYWLAKGKSSIILLRLLLDWSHARTNHHKRSLVLFCYCSFSFTRFFTNQKSILLSLSINYKWIKKLVAALKTFWLVARATFSLFASASAREKKNLQIVPPKKRTKKNLTKKNSVFFIPFFSSSVLIGSTAAGIEKKKTGRSSLGLNLSRPFFSLACLRWSRSD